MGRMQFLTFISSLEGPKSRVKLDLGPWSDFPPVSATACSGNKDFKREEDCPLKENMTEAMRLLGAMMHASKPQRLLVY